MANSQKIQMISLYWNQAQYSLGKMRDHWFIANWHGSLGPDLGPIDTQKVTCYFWVEVRLIAHHCSFADSTEAGRLDVPCHCFARDLYWNNSGEDLSSSGGHGEDPPLD